MSALQQASPRGKEKQSQVPPTHHATTPPKRTEVVAPTLSKTGPSHWAPHWRSLVAPMPGTRSSRLRLPETTSHHNLAEESQDISGETYSALQSTEQSQKYAHKFATRDATLSARATIPPARSANGASNQSSSAKHGKRLNPNLK